MHCWLTRMLTVGVFISGLLSCSLFSVAGMTNSKVPEDGRIVLEDYGYRNWGPALVNYRLPPERFAEDKLEMEGPEGKPQAFQVDGQTLSFVAEIPKGEEVVYTLRESDEQRKMPETAFEIKQADDRVIVSNRFFSLRLPAEESKTFSEPVPAGDVPEPLVAWRPADGPWMGDCRFADNRSVKRYAFRITRNGPVCFEFRAKYEFANGAAYVWVISVSLRVPYAKVTEEIDSRKLYKHNRNFLTLDLQKDWEPQSVQRVVSKGNKLGVETSDLQKFFRKRRESAKRKQEKAPDERRPARTKPRENAFHLETIVPGGKWGGETGGVMLASASKAEKAEDDADNFRMGIVPLHVGGWRRAMALNLWGQNNTGVILALPLDARWVWWQYDRTDERSPFSTHEHDPGFQETYARRVWGLYFGDKPGDAQRKYGYIGLDRYKDWILDWEERTQSGEKDAEQYPGGWFSDRIAKQMRKHVDQHPDKDILSRYYVVSQDPEDAVRHGKKFVNWIRSQEAQFNVEGLSHYRQAQTLMRAHYAADALACPEIPDQLRARIKRYVALWAHLMSSPDFNPRGSGVHLGNNNMTINRTIALGYFASLLPNHPRYDYWMESLKDFTRFKLATQTAPDGVWVACPNYQLYGPTRFLDAAINILHNAGVADLRGEYQADTLRYLANLTMRDTRFNNFRIIPGMGNSRDRVPSIFGLAMRSAGPELQGYLRDMHQRCVGDNGVGDLKYNSPWNAFQYKSWVEPADINLDTSAFPTYGVMFRHKFGEPEETGMLFRTGLNWSHWDTDVFNVILYGEGAPLSPGTAYSYYHGAAKHDNAIYHNQVKLVKHNAKEIFGRVDSPLRNYGFTENADYAMGERYYPPGLYEDEKARKWRRHVLFLKDQGNGEDDSYFVMRDTFPGNPDTDKTWWTWLNLGGPERIRVEGQPLPADGTPHGEVPELAALPVFEGKSVEMKSGRGAGTRFWFAGDPLRCRARVSFSVSLGATQNPDTPGMGFFKDFNKETKTVFEAMAEPGEDYFYVVYPHENDEQIPDFEKMAPGCLRITHDEFTDYAFIGDQDLNVDTENVRFTARSGMIRVFEDRVILSITGGKGRIGYKGYTIEGNAPFQRVMNKSNLNAQNRAIDGGNARTWKTVTVGDNIRIRGEKPFDAEVNGETLRIHTEGRKRVLLVSRPEFIRRPQYWVDGKEYMACWTDWPDSGAGLWQRTKMIALTVPAGEHELVVKDMTFPAAWEPRFEPVLNDVRSSEKQSE